MTNEITWTAGNGMVVGIKAQDGAVVLYLAGAYKGSVSIDTRESVPAAAQAAGVVAWVKSGNQRVGVTAERRVAIETLLAEVDAEQAPRREMERLEAVLAEAEYRLSTYGYGDTGARGHAAETARAALIAYRETHAEMWAQVQTERAQARDAHKAELRQSFIAQGLD